MIRVRGEPCPRFGDEQAEPPIKRTQINEQPRINEQAAARDRLEVARAALGGRAVEPAPLVDTTAPRGRGRPKRWASDAERMAAKRKAKAGSS